MPFVTHLALIQLLFLDIAGLNEDSTVKQGIVADNTGVGSNIPLFAVNVRLKRWRTSRIPRHLQNTVLNAGQPSEVETEIRISLAAIILANRTVSLGARLAVSKLVPLTAAREDIEPAHGSQARVRGDVPTGVFPCNNSFDALGVRRKEWRTLRTGDARINFAI